jgi:hypothetical protein
MTPSEIEPATFRLVPLCLNQLCHRVPPLIFSSQLLHYGPQLRHSVHSTSVSPKGKTILQVAVECLKVRVQKVHGSRVGLGRFAFKSRPAGRLCSVGLQSNEMRMSVTRPHALPSTTFLIHITYLTLWCSSVSATNVVKQSIRKVLWRQ